MFVSSASNYTILLGNSFLAPAKLTIDYLNLCIRCPSGAPISETLTETMDTIPCDIYNEDRKNLPWHTQLQTTHTHILNPEESISNMDDCDNPSDVSIQGSEFGDSEDDEGEIMTADFTDQIPPVDVATGASRSFLNPHFPYLVEEGFTMLLICRIGAIFQHFIVHLNSLNTTSHRK